MLGWDAARLFTSGDRPADGNFADTYERLLARRAGREPLAYITGVREFWALDFEVTPGVLIPRPETELIVEAALALFPGSNDRLTIVDVGTGSGCLAVSLAIERPASTVVATDVSPAALEVARRNARRHGVDGRVTFHEADLFAPGVDRVDLIVSNPPYVPAPSRPALQPEVRDHEPSVALFGGSDGLALVGRLVAEAPLHLRPGGYLIFEFGLGQEVEVADAIAASAALDLIDLSRDIQGIARTAITRRR